SPVHSLPPETASAAPVAAGRSRSPYDTGIPAFWDGCGPARPGVRYAGADRRGPACAGPVRTARPGVRYAAGRRHPTCVVPGESITRRALDAGRRRGSRARWRALILSAVGQSTGPRTVRPAHALGGSLS